MYSPIPSIGNLLLVGIFEIFPSLTQAPDIVLMLLLLGFFLLLALVLVLVLFVLPIFFPFVLMLMLVWLLVQIMRRG